MTLSHLIVRHLHINVTFVVELIISPLTQGHIEINNLKLMVGW